MPVTNKKICKSACYKGTSKVCAEPCSSVVIYRGLLRKYSHREEYVRVVVVEEQTIFYISTRVDKCSGENV